MLPRRTYRGWIALLVALVLGLCPVDVQAQAGRQPYSKEAIVGLLKGEVSPKRVAVLARQRGIDFQITSEVESELRRAGATDALLAALREVAPKPGQIVIQTSPSAQVYLDDVMNGQASPQGSMVIADVKPGDHTLRVSLAGKRDYEQKVTVPAGQEARVDAPLADLAGTVVVRTSPGAAVFLDDSSRGMTDARGQLAIPEVAAGSHELRVTASGKREYRETVRVAAGQEIPIDATLADIEKPKPKPPVETPRRGASAPAAGTVKENAKDGLRYVWIPPGTFMMGCSPGDNGCYDNEKPAHPVTITRGFWIGQTPVTVGAYKRFAGATGLQMPPEPNFGRALNPGWGNDAMPIVDVTWVEAQAYCSWSGGRLPTEAEWEYAARGGSSEARYGVIDDIAWYADNSGNQRLDSTLIWNTQQESYWRRLIDNGNGIHEVGQKRPNAFGLYDVLGNVWQWVNDWDDQYQNSPAQDPEGPSSGQYRLLRGGSYRDTARSVRVSYRTLGRPSPATEFDSNGFRCAGEVVSP
jgi:formylglycine-generating enzyme required for sulfatase activity